MRPFPRLVSEPKSRAISGYLLVSATLSAALFISCLYALQSFLPTLELDRQRLLSGEIWRIWTGHLVHTNMLHLSLNVSAALVIYFAFFSKIKTAELLVSGSVFAPLISILLLLIYPQLEWYNGLSGLLHALVAFFSLRLVRAGNKLFWIGIGIVWLKVSIESAGTNLGFVNIIGDMTIISEAHLIGASIGTLTAIIGMPFWRETEQSEVEGREVEQR